MNKSLKQRKLWLELALFAGAFLPIYGLISSYEACGGFFTCYGFTNRISVTFYQQLITYVGIALFISSIGLMSIGEAGSGGHFPSKHAILDFAFVMGAFLFVSGYGAFYTLCGESCWAYSYEFGLPLMLLGAFATLFSMYYLAKNHRTKGTRIFTWELLIVVCVAVLLVSELTTPLNGQVIVPMLQFNNVTASQLALVSLSLFGIIVGLYGIRNENRKLMIQRKSNQAPIPKIENTPIK